MKTRNFFRWKTKTISSQIASHYSSGITLLNQKRFDEAIPQFQMVLSLKPDHPLAHYQLGLIYYQKNMFAEALPCFTKALEINTNEISIVSLYIMLAATYNSLGDFDQALQAYTDALKLEPNENVLHLGMGDLYFQHKKYDKAIVCFEKTSDIDPEALIYIAKIYWLTKEQTKALSILQEATTTFPDSSDVQAYLGHYLSEMEKYQVAIKHLHKAIELADPINEDVLFSLADAYYWNNDLEHSLEICKQGAKLFPDNSSFARRLGFIYEKQGNLEAAIESWKRLVDIDSSSADAHHILALGFRSYQDFGAALREIEQTLVLDPKDAAAYSTKGTLLWDLGRCEEVIAALESAINLGHSLSLLELASLYEFLGNYDKATFYAKAFLDEAETNEELKIGIEDALAILNNQKD